MRGALVGQAQETAPGGPAAPELAFVIAKGSAAQGARSERLPRCISTLEPRRVPPRASSMVKKVAPVPSRERRGTTGPADDVGLPLPCSCLPTPPAQHVTAWLRGESADLLPHHSQATDFDCEVVSIDEWRAINALFPVDYPPSPSTLMPPAACAGRRALRAVRRRAPRRVARRDVPRARLQAHGPLPARPRRVSPSPPSLCTNRTSAPQACGARGDGAACCIYGLALAAAA